MSASRSVVLTVSLILAGCASLPPPQRGQPDSSGIGIAVTLRAPVTWFSIGTQIVYFVNLDDERDARRKTVIQSNYTKDGRVYLLNVPPGDYVAVAAFTAKRPPGAPDYGRLCTESELASARTRCNKFYSYFSKELIELTRVSVGKGQFVFAGTYVIDNTPGLSNADPVQFHYAEVIAPGVIMGPGDVIREALLNLTAPDTFHYRGSVHEARRDDNAKSEFLTRAKQDLAEGGWSTVIR